MSLLHAQHLLEPPAQSQHAKQLLTSPQASHAPQERLKYNQP